MPQTPPTETVFDLRVRVTDQAVSVDCEFPGGKLAVTGDAESTLTLVKQFLPKISEYLNKGV